MVPLKLTLPELLDVDPPPKWKMMSLIPWPAGCAVSECTSDKAPGSRRPSILIVESSTSFLAALL